MKQRPLVWMADRKEVRPEVSEVFIIDWYGTCGSGDEGREGVHCRLGGRRILGLLEDDCVKGGCVESHDQEYRLWWLFGQVICRPDAVDSTFETLISGSMVKVSS